METVFLFWNSFRFIEKLQREQRALVPPCPQFLLLLISYTVRKHLSQQRDRHGCVAVKSTLLLLLRKTCGCIFPKIQISELSSDRPLLSSLPILSVFHRIFLYTRNYTYTYTDPFYFGACFFILVCHESFSTSVYLDLSLCIFFFNGHHTLFCTLLKCNISYLFPDFKSSRLNVRSGTPPFYLILEVRDHLPAFVAYLACSRHCQPLAYIIWCSYPNNLRKKGSLLSLLTDAETKGQGN